MWEILVMKFWCIFLRWWMWEIFWVIIRCLLLLKVVIWNCSIILGLRVEGRFSGLLKLLVLKYCINFGLCNRLVSDCLWLDFIFKLSKWFFVLFYYFRLSCLLMMIMAFLIVFVDCWVWVIIWCRLLMLVL